MDPTTVQIGISLITIVGSGLTTAYVNHRLARDRAEREFKREKLEELFMAIHHYCHLLFARNYPWVDVMSGRKDYDDVLKEIAEDPPTGGHYETVIMLVNIYFRRLRPQFDAILACREEINDIRAVLKQRYRQSGPDPSLVKSFVAAISKIEAVEENFKEQLFKEADHIATEDAGIFGLPWIKKHRESARVTPSKSC